MSLSFHLKINSQGEVWPQQENECNASEYATLTLDETAAQLDSGAQENCEEEFKKAVSTCSAEVRIYILISNCYILPSY